MFETVNYSFTKWSGVPPSERTAINGAPFASGILELRSTFDRLVSVGFVTLSVIGEEVVKYTQCMVEFGSFPVR